MRITFSAAILLAIASPAQLCAANEVQFNKSLIAHLRSPDASTRMAAVKKIGQYGAAAKSAVSELSSVMCRDKNGKVANQAAASLVQIGRSAVPELMRVLEQESQEARWRALWALGRMGPAAEKAAPLLKLLLRDLTPRYRAMAAQALGEIGPKAADAVPALLDAMNDSNAEVRNQAMVAIANIGKYAVPPLIPMLRDTSAAQLRIVALNACRVLGKNAEKALPDLIEILEIDEPPLRAMAAAAIAGIGKPAQKAIPVLLERLRDKHFPTQRHSLSAILAVGLNDFPGLLDHLSKINTDTEWAAPFILQQFGRQAKDAVPHLVKALDSEKEGVRLGSALALRRLGVDATSAIPALNKRLADKSVIVRAAALSALETIYLQQPGAVNQRRQKRLALIKNSIAKKQQQVGNELLNFTKTMSRVDLQLAAAPKPSIRFTGINQLMQTNSIRQSEFFAIVRMHLFTSSVRRRGANSAYKNIDRFGPEGVPALIYGINQAAIYRMGFC